MLKASILDSSDKYLLVGLGFREGELLLELAPPRKGRGN